MLSIYSSLALLAESLHFKPCLHACTFLCSILLCLFANLREKNRLHDRAGQNPFLESNFDSSTSFDDSHRIIHPMPRITTCRNHVLRRFPLLLMLYCSATSHKLLMNHATSISLIIYFIISFPSSYVNL